VFLLRNIQERIGSAIAAVIAAIFFFACGAILAFVISPQQAVEWRRIQSLPELDAASYASAATDAQVAITGILQDNQALTEDGLVAYTREEWEVDPPDPDSEDDEPDGSWNTVEEQAPPLKIAIGGGTVKTLSASSPTFGGNLQETVELGPGPLSAEDFGGQQLPEGSIRTQGFRDGDLITVVGQKGSTGDLAPSRLFGGDRVQLVDNIRSGARAAFMIGIGLMICSPFVLILGVLAGLFGRKR
jgi:hypothetical protein